MIQVKKKMDNRRVFKIYPKGFKREHSIHLKSVFNINPNGIDHHTPKNLAVEFKESFANKDGYLWFKVPKKQVDVADVFVFCVKEERCYVVDKEDILGNYSFKTKKKNANVRLGTVKSMALFETSNLFELDNFLNQLEM